MKGMLKAELFKFKHSYVLWVILGAIFASCTISIFTGTYNSAEQALINITEDSMVLILACAIYSAIILTEDFSNGILRHYIANGYKRSSIIFAKFIHCLVGCSILLLIYPVICVSLAAIIQGVETSFVAVLKNVLLSFVKTLPLYWGIFGLFFLASILIQKGAIVVSISVATSILLVVFTNKLYSDTSSIIRYSPIIQISEVANSPVSISYFVSILISLAFLAVCVLLSMIKFCHDEL